MNSRVKTLLFAGALLLSLGSARPLLAQANISVARTYTGTAIQTTAAGQRTTGTFALYVRTDGEVFAKTVINDVVIDYFGTLAAFTEGSTKTTGAAYVSGARSYTIVGGKVVYGPKQPKIPVFIKNVEVYGGILDQSGNELLFHGDPGPYPDPIIVPAAAAVGQSPAS